MMRRHSLTLFADYFQFYLWDASIVPDAPTDWGPDDFSRRAKVEPGIVVICPVRNMTVPVNIEIHDSEPPYDQDRWDHVVECSLDLPSGVLEVHECTGGSAAKIETARGMQRIRVLYGDLNTLDESGLEGNDQYWIQLWPGEARELKVVKLFPDF